MRRENSVLNLEN